MSKQDDALHEFISLTQEQFAILAELRDCAAVAFSLPIQRDIVLLRGRRLGLKPDQLAKAAGVSRVTVFRAIENVQELDKKMWEILGFQSDGEEGIEALCMECKMKTDNPHLDLAAWTYRHLTEHHGWNPKKLR